MVRRCTQRLVLLALVPTAACSGKATSFYPLTPDAAAERPEVDAERLIVIFDEREPPCAHTDLGTIVYDWARDGVFTSSERALEGTVARAAKMGATGIHHITYNEGAVVSQGSAMGTAQKIGETTVGTSFGFAASGREVGVSAVAFVCDGVEATMPDAME
jgi:hypothetical protein